MQSIGDQVTESWVWHQLGTRELCLGNQSSTQKFLNEALRIRESLGDKIGAEATRHNLNILNQVPDISEKPSANIPEHLPESHLLILRFPLWLKVIVAIFGLFLIGWGIKSVLSNYQARVVLAPENLDFNTLEINQTSPAKTLTFSNQGLKPLKILAIVISGERKDNFKTISGGCATGDVINPQDICQISIDFTPKTPGQYNAELTIYHDASDTPQLVQLTGSGSEIPVPILVIESQILDFGDIFLGDSNTAEITIDNAGSASLKIISSKIDSQEFEIIKNDCANNSSVEPEKNCQITIKFQPRNEGDHQAILAIAHNAAGNPKQVQLTGNATKRPVPNISLNRASLTFGKQEIGDQSSQPQTITVTNTGSASLKITSTKINSQEFEIIKNNCANNYSVEPEKNCQITVKFQPRNEGDRQAILEISHNAAGSPKQVQLTGNATNPPRPNISLSRPSLTFRKQEIGDQSSQSQTITVTNTGSASLKITSTNIDSQEFKFVKNSCANNSSVEPEKNCQITIKFQPRNEGDRQAILEIAHNAAGSPKQVQLTGNATNPPGPNISLSRTSLTFGQQEIGDQSSPPQTIIVTNTGSAPLSITNIQIEGNHTNDFSPNHTNEFSPTGRITQTVVAPGDQYQIDVSFYAQGEGKRDAKLSISSDAFNSPVIIYLNGIGTRN